MEKIILKQEILDKIKKDPILFGRVAKALEIIPISLPRLLYSIEPVKLTQANVLKVLREYLGVQDNELLEVMQEA